MSHADYKTDTIIQTSLRNELNRDVTLIMVAHRLQTIIDADKVVSHHSPPHPTNTTLNYKQMVLDAGRIVSFPPPTRFRLKKIKII
jgi:ABC-type transport system involved in cytochrome bd biosynthesis fused ATPase/permease subunit